MSNSTAGRAPLAQHGLGLPGLVLREHPDVSVSWYNGAHNIAPARLGPRRVPLGRQRGGRTKQGSVMACAFMLRDRPSRAPQGGLPVASGGRRRRGEGAGPAAKLLAELR